MVTVKVMKSTTGAGPGHVTCKESFKSEGQGQGPEVAPPLGCDELPGAVGEVDGVLLPVHRHPTQVMAVVPSEGGLRLDTGGS